MSVLKNNRGESKAEFLYNARQLQIYTIRKATHFPKRYTFYISQHLVDLATDIYNDVKIANSIYVTNQHEAQIRKDFFIKAKAKCMALVSQVELAAEIFSIQPETMEEWMGMVDAETSLIDGVVKSDKDRYKNLP